MVSIPATGSSATTTMNELCERIKATWPQEELGESWYLLVLCAKVACFQPQSIAPLYAHLASSSHTTAAAREQLSARLKDALMKIWPVTGIPTVITAVSHLAAAEHEAGAVEPPPLDMQRAQSHYLPKDIGPGTAAEGDAFIHAVYRHHLEPIMAAWGAHRADFDWLQKRVIYGLFLSDHAILDPKETLMLTMTAMLCQELKPPAFWHVRGLRRMGVSREATYIVMQSVRDVIKSCDREEGEWPDLEEVESSLAMADGHDG